MGRLWVSGQVFAEAPLVHVVLPADGAGVRWSPALDAAGGRDESGPSGGSHEGGRRGCGRRGAGIRHAQAAQGRQGLMVQRAAAAHGLVMVLGLLLGLLGVDELLHLLAVAVLVLVLLLDERRKDGSSVLMLLLALLRLHSAHHGCQGGGGGSEDLALLLRLFAGSFSDDDIERFQAYIMKSFHTYKSY